MEQRVGKDYYDWVCDYWTTRGEPLEFVKRKYLVAIYKDQSPYIVTMKAAQTGATERAISEALWLADVYKENSGYFFPTSGAVSDLVQERVDDPINNNAYLNSVSGRAKRLMGKQADKIGLKRMSKGFVYFRGAQNPRQITSVPIDTLFIDEVDLIDEKMIPYLNKRLQASSRKWQRWFSTPTIPKFGIHALYESSDKHEWHVTCTHCKKEQILTFDDNIDKENKTIICKECKEILIPWECDGRWIDKDGVEWSEDKVSDVRGFHLCQIYSPTFDVKLAIIESEKNSEWEIQQFHNQTLGEPYEPKGARITEEDINNCIKDYNMPFNIDKPKFMGVDVGKKLHYVIRTEDRIVEAGDCVNFTGVDSIEEKINNFKVKGVVIDALPETRKAQELANTFKRRVKLCYYTGLVEMKEAGKYWKVDKDKVNTDRTVSLDMTFAEIKKAEIEMPKNINSCKDFRSHMKSTTRIIREDKKGALKAEYVKTSDDHLLHASNYAKLATNIFNVATPEVFIV